MCAGVGGCPWFAECPAGTGSTSTPPCSCRACQQAVAQGGSSDGPLLHQWGAHTPAHASPHAPASSAAPSSCMYTSMCCPRWAVLPASVGPGTEYAGSSDRTRCSTQAGTVRGNVPASPRTAPAYRAPTCGEHHEVAHATGRRLQVRVPRLKRRAACNQRVRELAPGCGASTGWCRAARVRGAGGSTVPGGCSSAERVCYAPSHSQPLLFTCRAFACGQARAPSPRDAAKLCVRRCHVLHQWAVDDANDGQHAALRMQVRNAGAPPRVVVLWGGGGR